MAVVGKFLRQAREKQKYTLEEISQMTKIDVKYLQALEEDRFDQIPSPFYVRIFLKNYAKFLGLNYEPLLNFYEKSVGRPSALPSAKTQSSPPQKPINETPRHLERKQNISAKPPGQLTRHTPRKPKKTTEESAIPSSLPKRSEVHKKSSSLEWVWIAVLLALLGGGAYMYLSLFQ